MLLALIMNVIYAKAIGITQGIIGREVNTDMWLSTMFGIAQGIVMAYLAAKVMQHTPALSLVEMTGKLVGAWGGKLVAAIMFLFFTGTFATVMVTFVYHLMDYFLPEAPAAISIRIGLSP